MLKVCFLAVQYSKFKDHLHLTKFNKTWHFVSLLSNSKHCGSVFPLYCLFSLLKQAKAF